MLGFIFGRAHSGKTEMVFNKIKEDVKNGREVLLIVPEQSTADYERKLLHILGDSSITRIPVLSFTRLCDEVGRVCGGICSKRLSECDRLIFMSRALSAVADKLTFFGKYISNIRFTENVLSVIDEFKRGGMTGDDIRLFAQKLGGGLSNKLFDIALLMDTYDGLLENKFADTGDDLAVLYRQLSEYAYFAEKTVYIDSFKNFTGAQIKILDRIIKQSDSAIFSFCYDTSLSDDAELFSNVAKTIKSLTEIAKKNGIRIEKPIVLPNTYYNSPDITALECGLSIGKTEEVGQSYEGVTLCTAESIYAEAEFAACEIRRLVREKGYRYRDFVIMSRSDDQYRAAVEYMCNRYAVPCFTDRRFSVKHLPLSVFISAAISAINGFSTENILKYLKTELAGLSADEIGMLENYVYIWKISGKKWFDDWNMSPSGLDKFDDKDKQLLKDINNLRARAVMPLSHFKSEFCGNAQNMAKAIWNFLEYQNVGDKLAAFCEQLDLKEAELVKQGYNAVLQILDSLVVTLGESENAKDFCEYLLLALGSTTVGIIPQMLDEVTFGAADRIKPSQPKVCFILGLNQGVFPSVVTTNGIIASGERLALLEAGMPINDYTIGFSIDEQYLLYNAVCCASDKVYLCYTTNSENEPSPIIEKVVSILPCCKQIDFADASPAEKIETAASAFTAMFRDRESELSKSLCEYLLSISPYAQRLNAINQSEEPGSIKITPEVSRKLFGKNLYLSATGVDTYFRCAFSYFCRYGLRAKVLNPAEIDSLHRGTIVHDALENVVSGNGENLVNMSDKEIDVAVSNTVDEYLKNIEGIEQIADNRFKYIVSAIKSLSSDVVKHIRDDFRQNGFKPVKCELKIGGANADIEDAVIKTKDGNINLIGAIDRVDSFGAYIRVVDYKTGSRKFRLSDVLYGLNMQMLLYLYAVMKSKKFADFKPAGVLYLETYKAPDSDSNFRMNGLMLRDETVHGAMDAENAGKFVSALKIKKDGTFYKSNDFIDGEGFDKIFDHIESMLCRMNSCLKCGDIAVAPTDSSDKDACKYCDYSAICGIENRAHRKVKSIDNERFFSYLDGGEANV